MKTRTGAPWPATKAGFAFALAMSLLAMPAAAADIAKFRELAGKAVEEYQRIQSAARETVARERNDGRCSERASQLMEHVDEAVVLARLSSEIYDHPYALQMKNSGQTVARFRGDDGRVLVAHRDPASEGYAEVFGSDEQSGPLIVVFRGTRLASMKDIMANLVQFADAAPVKYRWAATLVSDLVARHPGRPIIATGHSMGGGLAMYAAVGSPIKAYTFNPAGLSRGSMGGLASAQLRSAQERVVSFIARSGEAIEPVSALSLAGESSILGRRYLVDVGSAANPIRQHDMSRLLSGISGMSERRGTLRAQAVCTDDLGYQRL